MQTPVNATQVIDSDRSGRWPTIDVDWSAHRRQFFQQKYAAERAFAFVLLIAFAPLIGVLWLVVRGTSPGPGFYRQLRVGLNGKCFEVIKLRSMRKNAEPVGKAIWCQQRDQRITFVGGFLRKLHLDELPQLWNVVKGEMVLVGPRPERPSICKKLAEKVEGYYDRNLVKPGISGLSQINLPADESLDDVQRKQILDLTYINETSGSFELRILVATALRIVGVKGETVMGLMRLCRRPLIDSLQPEVSIDMLPIAKHITMDAPAVDAIPQSTATTALPTFFDEHFSPSQSVRVRNPSPVPVGTTDGQGQGAGLQLGKVANCMTVDVEDYFQVSAFSNRVTRSDWDRYQCRVETNTDKVLSVFNEAGVRATFFVLGWVAERYPALVRRIVADGHEVASHGYWHQLVYDLTPEQFASDVTASREAIYNACGVEVTAYRAPSFSIVPRSRWALDVLAELGFKTDSSIFPISGHDRYGDPDAPKGIHRIHTQHGDLTELPPTLGYAGRVPVPVGGGYFRLFPLKLTQRAIDDIRNRIGPAMFYLHPWELDPDQPRVFADANRKSRFRHYVGLKTTEKKLRKLLRSHSFDTVGNVAQAVMPVEPAQQHGSLKPSRRPGTVPAPAAALRSPLASSKQNQQLC